MGRDAASRHLGLFSNAIQVTCSSSYFQRFYVAHKDVGLPQVWPRPQEKALNPPHARFADLLVFLMLLYCVAWLIHLVVAFVSCFL